MSFIKNHPRLSAWLALAVGMVAILVWSARDVGLEPGQWAALIVATIGLAGLCVWIIGWEDVSEAEDASEAENTLEADPVETEPSE
jgi:hypothetical protein